MKPVIIIAIAFVLLIPNVVFAESGSTGTKSVQGSSDLIDYATTGGVLLRIMPDSDANSLIVSIETTEDGSLTLIIPRSVLDAKLANGDDDNFFVLVDGIEVDFNEITRSTSRTLTIAFPVGTDEIEIIGTFVVPPTHSSSSTSSENFPIEYVIVGIVIAVMAVGIGIALSKRKKTW